MIILILLWTVFVLSGLNLIAKYLFKQYYYGSELEILHLSQGRLLTVQYGWYKLICLIAFFGLVIYYAR